MTTPPPDHGRPDDDRTDDDRTALRPGASTPPTLSPPPSSPTTSLRPGPVDRASPSGRRRGRSRAPFVVVVCALAIILGMAGGIAFVVRYGGAAGLGASPSPSPTPSGPDAVVRAYLHALARGDAQAALRLGVTQPADTAFTTNQVLGAAVRAHPITQINVPAVPQSGPTPDESATVEASYLIGDERVTTSFDLTRVGQHYRLDKTTSTWDVSSLRSKRVPLRVAGKRVNSDSVTLLPAAYPITTGMHYLTWGTNHTLLVKEPDDFLATSGFALTINDAGAKAMREAIKAELSRCVKVRKAKPSGCPFAFTDSSYTVKDKTVRWAFAEDPLADFTPRLSYDDDGVGTASLNLKLTFKAKAVRTYNDESTNLDESVTTYATATADLTKDSVSISWKD